jgi:CheY-like chemotaxis protein
MKNEGLEPVRSVTDCLPAADAATEITPFGRVAGRKSNSIMVVDDVEINRDLLSIILNREGHSVISVPDGKSAVSAAERTIFDLIVMDIRMPGMDGLEAARRIRELSNKNRTTPILGLTANVVHDRLNEYRAAGIDDQVSKSVSILDLLKKVAEWSERGRVT